jgi:hypothetical protein
VLHVIWGAIVDEIEILRIHRHALQNGRNAPHDDVANFVPIEDFD